MATLEPFWTRTRKIYALSADHEEESSLRINLSSKISDFWLKYSVLPRCVLESSNKTANPPSNTRKQEIIDSIISKRYVNHKLLNDNHKLLNNKQNAELALPKKSANLTGISSITHSNAPSHTHLHPFNPLTLNESRSEIEEELGSEVKIKEFRKVVRPGWHAPWRLMRVISGHVGWVRCVAVEPKNEWFCTGAGDRMIKIWDLASGTLKLTLTGHISTVRGLVVSRRHPYLFSCGEDKQIKCWDLESNKVVRHYHGHLSGIYALDMHPELDVLASGGRDATVRVWDIRTKMQIFALTGHKSTVSSIKMQSTDPQILSSSMDSTIRLWDLAAGKTMCVLTNHKKAVRSLVINPYESTFVSASPDNIKQWRLPKGDFIQNFEGHNAIVNTLAINTDGVLFSGGDNGTLKFWDYKTGYNFQTSESLVQPGSLDSEAGILCSTFDYSGARLITGEADKSIKIWKEDPNATPDTHPVNWKPSLLRSRY